MLKTKYLVISSVVVAALAAMPLIVSSQVDKKLEATKTFLEQNGLKQELLTKSGYLTGTRTFNVEVVDAKKARDFLLNQLVEKNAQYKLFAQGFKEETDAGINAAIDGLKFKGEMTNSNLLLGDVKVSLVLEQLPKSIQEEITQNKEANTIIAPLLARGVLGVDMLFGMDEKLKEFKLKDIKEEFKAEGVTFNVDTKDQVLRLNNRGESIYGTLGVGHQLFSVNGDMMTSKSELKDFVYNFTYNNEFNNKANLSIGNFALEANDEYTNLKIGLGSLKATSSIEDVQKDLQIKSDYTVDNIAFLNSGDDIKLDQLFAKLFLRGLNSDTIKKVQADYNTLVLGTTPLEDQVMIDDFVALINNGVKIDLGVVFKGLNAEIIKLKDVSVDTTLEVAKNNFSDKQSPLALIGLLDISSKVKIHKDDRTTLEGLGLTAPEDFALGKADGDFFIYEIAMKKGAISVNGKTIQ